MSSGLPRALSRAVRAPAKLNLYLKVLGRRPDGYHELDSVMARLDLADRVRLFLRPGPDRLTSAASLPGGLPAGFDGPGNLVLKAAAAYRRRAGWPDEGLEIRLEKHIPVSAGLGGGSSDGAAVLAALNRASPRPLAPGALLELGRSLGADLPFFLQPRPLVRAGGRGEIFSPAPAAFKIWAGRRIFLYKPDFNLSTAEVFKNLGLTNPPADNNLGPVSEPGENDLWAAAAGLAPALAGAAGAVRALAPEAWGLSGSGPTFWFFSPRKSPAALEEGGGWLRPARIALR
ncbi:MAG: 4-(cytidine 5'-diphospho)-2-C-methyl-D-erythritol kinase [Candidatus Adiutrix sp.]|jgi:4-diphosphocytidyl-2-C-methyl-D-erythritol kinase|nr:4-(cytidine 5'-diphospho)-2-C-methyl-D-erythritol kinase [Candidatus Adiutrix sp.]